MKITKSQLKQIIKEELSKVLNERMPRRGSRRGEVGRDRPQGSWDSEYDVWSELAEAIKNFMKKPDHVFNTIVHGEPSTEDLRYAARLYEKMWERYGGYSRGSIVGGTTISRVLDGVNNEDRPEGNQEFIEHIRNMSELKPHEDYQWAKKAWGLQGTSPDFINPSLDKHIIQYIKDRGGKRRDED